MQRISTSVLALVLLISLKSASAAVQEFTIYSEKDQNGTSVVFQDKIPDLSEWKDFLETSASFCTTGMWMFYTEINFGGYPTGFFSPSGSNYEFEQRICNNNNFAGFASARYRGPSDTTSPVLSLTEGTSNSNYAGRESLITGDAETVLDFIIPKFISSFGTSNWTLFSEANFGGVSTCFMNDGYNYMGRANAEPILSVRQGC